MAENRVSPAAPTVKFVDGDEPNEHRECVRDRRRLEERLEAQQREYDRHIAARDAELAKAKAEWELTFSAIDRPIAILERDLHVVRANGAYVRLTGRAAGEVVGGRCHQLLFHAAEPCAACPLASEGDLPAQAFEVSGMGARSFSMNCYAAAGKIVCVYRETTDERVRLRRMLQAEKLAAVGQLAGGVAHEINNPLGAILAFSQLMLREPGRPESDLEIFRDIEHAALRCKRIVESLLKFSRRASPAKVVFDCNHVIEEAAVLFGAQLKGYPKAVFKSELWPVPLQVLGDPNEIEQVVLNLLVNALQALKNGEGTVTARSKQNGQTVDLSVSDDGIGILPENRPRIFEPAFTTKPPGEGTGFGLVISWAIAENHGGRLDFESEPQKGSTFTLTLPLANNPPD
jgi:two-component system NtrC family sensor kinase